MRRGAALLARKHQRPRVLQTLNVTAVLGAVTGAELGVSAAARHLSIFKRSKGSLLQAPENLSNEFQSIFPSLSSSDVCFFLP